MNFDFSRSTTTPVTPPGSRAEATRATFSLEDTSYSLSRKVRYFDTLTPRQANKEVIYIEFQNAAEQEPDKFWGNLLLLASRGEFKDKKIKYNGKYLIKRDTDSFEMMPTTPLELAAAFKRFMQQHNGIVSGDEMEKQRIIMDRIMNRRVTLRWDMCSDDRKAELLFDYAARQARDFEMSTSQRLSLEKCIEVGLIEGSITSSTVAFDLNAVQNISCITRHEDGYWHLRSNNMQIKRRKKPKTKTKTVEDMWFKLAANYT